MKNDNACSTDALHPFITEREYSKAPSKSDYRATRQLLNDFGIHLDKIPPFGTLSALLRWRSATIQAKLA